MSKKLITLAFCLSLLGAVAVFAQDQDAGAVEEPPVQKTTLWQMVKQGGWAMWPLGGFSVLMVSP